MQHFRGILTRLKSLMTEKLPDEDDLYGYDGVSKNNLLAAIESAHVLSQEITPNDETRFEVISLKRAGSELYKTLKDFFDLDDQGAKKKHKFNEFLDCLSKLVEKTKLTYFVIAKNGMRDDEELARIRARVADLSALQAEIAGAVEPAKEAIEEIHKHAELIGNAHTTIANQADEITKWHAEAATKFSQINETHDNAEEWNEEIDEIGTRYKVLLKQIEDSSASAERRRDELRNYAELGKEISEQLIKSTEEHKKLLKEITETLGDANRVSMAAAFKSRKDELRTPQIVWQVIFITAIAGIVSVVWNFLIPSIAKGDTLMIAVEIGFVAPFVWLGWFAAEQYSYTSKILEDYAFKAAAAMSYEGHKNAAREADPELEGALLRFSMYNMSENPIRLYGEGVHGSPLHKFSDSLLSSIFGKQKGQTAKRVASSTTPQDEGDPE